METYRLKDGVQTGRIRDERRHGTGSVDGGLCLGPLEKQHLTIDAVEIPACDTYRTVTEQMIQRYEDMPALLLAASGTAGS